VPSDIERVTDAYRSRLLQADAAAHARIVVAHTRARDAILARLAETIASLPESERRVLANARWRALLDDVEDRITAFARGVGAEVVAGQRAAVVLAGEATRASLAIQAPRLVGSFASVPTSALVDVVGAMRDGSPLGAYLAEYGPKARAAAEDVLTNAVTLGLGPREEADELAAVLNTSKWLSLTTARSAVLDALRNASLRTYAANARILDGWVWIATRSRSSCLGCLHRHGSVYPLSVRFFPSHANCRCSPAPVATGGRGVVDETGEAWFARQDASTQQAMMSGDAYAAYQRGEVTLADFAGERNDPRWGPSVYERSWAEVAVTTNVKRAA